MEIQILRINKKLEKLRRKDKDFETFGSEKHQYKLNSPKTENELLEFEKTHQIKLPIGYREFLKKIGNGGAGPYYGLETLENSTLDDLDTISNKERIIPSKPFKFEKAWNLDFEKLADLPEDAYFQQKEITNYFDKELMNGALRISNFGCGVSLNLIVNGKEYGNIWADDRCNDQGIYPDPYFKKSGRIQFLDWYEYWLNDSLKNINFDKIVNFSIEKSISKRLISFMRRIMKR